MNHKLLRFTVALLLSLPAATMNATEVTVLPALTVTATRAPAEHGQVAFPIRIFDSAELLDAPVLDQALRSLAGFSLFRRTGSLAANPTTQGASLRGIGPSGTSRALVLFDGVPFNDAFGGWVYWGQVDLAAVERVEVLRGGGSAAWGNTALGGVIHVIPRLPDSDSLRIAASLGSEATAGASVYATSRTGRLGLSLAGRTFTTAGYTRVSPAQRGEVDVPTDARQRSASITSVYDFSATTRLVIRGFAYDEERGNGTPLARNSTDAWRIHARMDWGERAQWRADAYATGSTYASTFTSVAGERASETMVLDQYSVPSSSSGGTLRRVIQLAEHVRMTVGADLRMLDGKTRERVVFQNADRIAGGKQLLSGAFAELDGAHEIWTWQFAARADSWRVRDGFIQQPHHDAQTFADRSATMWNGRAGSSLQAADWLRLRGAIYQAFRVPTINELYRPFQVGSDVTMANALLDPERLHGAELGFDLNIAGGFDAGLTVFSNTVADPILNVTIGTSTQGGQLRQRRNIDRTRIQGLELDLEWRISPLWRATGSLALTDAVVQKALQQPELAGNQLAHVADMVATAGLHLNPLDGAFGFSLRGRYGGAGFEDDRNQLKLAAFFVLDLVFNYHFANGRTLYLAVDNLLDRRYADGISGTGIVTHAPPRQLRAGVHWLF